MEWWQITSGILGVIGTIGVGVYSFFRNKSTAKVETFKSIMEESKRFREEIRIELNQSKQEILNLKELVKSYEQKIKDLEDRLREALLPRTWSYFYIQKPIKLFELESIIKRYINSNSVTDYALVVGDDPFTQKAIESLFYENDWKFLKSHNGNIAVDMLKVNLPKIIIIDFVLPVADSFEILNAIHENRNFANIPVIAISSNNLREVDRIFLHSKINESLTKP